MDKFAGAVVGAFASDRAAAAEGMDGEEAARGAAVEEVLVLARGRGLLEAALAPTTGEVIWRAVADAGAAARRVLARSQMTSMLRDGARNALYARAIEAAVRDHRAASASGAGPAVLDIGAGTGLLSLLAAREGASRVDAIEQWPTTAAVAAAVARDNAAAGGERVRVLARHSADVGVEGEAGVGAATADDAAAATRAGGGAGEAADGGASEGAAPRATLPARADLVISEIVDSVLLGEGVLPALRDA
jgi:type III protein arginine methyltransferase